MAREILDRSKSYLELFTHEVEIDYSLTKYKVVFDKAKIDAVRLEKEHGSVEKAVEKYFGVGHDSPVDVRDIPAFNGDKKREFFRKESASLVVDKEFFESLTADDLTILIDEEKRKGVYRKFQNTINQLSFVTPDELFEAEDVGFADTTIPTEQRVVREQLPGFWNRLLRKKKERVGTFRTDTNQEIFRNEPKPKPKQVPDCKAFCFSEFIEEINHLVHFFVFFRVDYFCASDVEADIRCRVKYLFLIPDEYRLKEG